MLTSLNSLKPLSKNVDDPTRSIKVLCVCFVIRNILKTIRIIKIIIKNYNKKKSNVQCARYNYLCGSYRILTRRPLLRWIATILILKHLHVKIFKTRIEEAIEELIDLIFEKVSSDFFANTVQMPQYLIYSTF